MTDKQRFRYATSVSFGGDTPTAEFEVELTYTFLPGSPERGPTYASGGEPPDPPEVDDVRLELVDGRPRPWQDGPHLDQKRNDDELEESVIDKLYDALIEDGEAQYRDEMVAAMEYRAEARRDTP